MKQLYAAGSLGMSSTLPDADWGLGVPTPAVRASTAGLRPDELEAALSLANYTPPPRSGDAAKALPVRLALFRTPATGRVLTHITPNGGNYFAHTLLNVPSTADAQLAIQTWGSPLWQRHEPSSTADLPDLPYLPVSDQLDDTTLRDWLQSSPRRELLEFVLSALLNTKPETRIFLAANSDDVARVVYAVTRALPQDLLEEFTFSTYEANPLQCPARLVGCDLGEGDAELPEVCYSGESVAFNLASLRRSEQLPAAPFAAFAVESLATADYAPLDDLKATWQRLGLREPQQWELVYRMTRGTGTLTKEEATHALQHPPMVGWIANRSDAWKQLLDWAIEDHEFAETCFTRVAQALRQKTDTMQQVAQTVRERGMQALTEGDQTRTANALELILPMVAPSKANAIWGEILAKIPDPAQLSWQMHWYLLPRLIRFKQLTGGSLVDPGLTSWLTVPAEQLAQLLALDLPAAYQLAAIRASLVAEAELSSTLIEIIGQHPPLALQVLQPVEGVTAEQSTKLFEGLLQHAGNYPWLEQLLDRATDYPADLLNRFFEAALGAGRVDAERLIRSQGPRLLELFAGQTGLDRVGTLFLANPPADLLTERRLLEFLEKLRDEPLTSHELLERIRHVQAARRYLDHPQLTVEAMRPIATALQITPPVVPPTTRQAVFEEVVTELIRHCAEDHFQNDLETVLQEFGSVLANDASDLYENLLRVIRGRVDFPRQENLLVTFLAVALGAVRNPVLNGQLDGLDSHAFAIAAEAANRGGRSLLRVIDQRAESWPKQARTQWAFLAAAVRPRGLSGFIRDFAFVLFGAAIASVGWAAWILMN